MLWRGESFSSHAGAKHLPVSPQAGEAAPLLFILPPGTLTLAAPAWSRLLRLRVRPAGAGAALPCPEPGIFCWMLLDLLDVSCASASPGPCVSLFPRKLLGKDAPVSTFGGD